MVSCGRCDFCREGDGNLCDNRMVLGVSCGEYRRHGAFAERISVPRRIVYRLPDSLPFEQAALVEAVSVAVHAANVTPVQLGATAVVVGTGMIGLLTLQAARAAGASQVIAVDLNEKRLAVARELGADQTLNAENEDVPTKIREFTNGKGADVAFEVVGAQVEVESAGVREDPLERLRTRFDALELGLLRPVATVGRVPVAVVFSRPAFRACEAPVSDFVERAREVVRAVDDPMGRDVWPRGRHVEGLFPAPFEHRPKLLGEAVRKHPLELGGRRRGAFSHVRPPARGPRRGRSPEPTAQRGESL